MAAGEGVGVAVSVGGKVYRGHACNEPLRCPECIRRFWQWAENHTRGKRRRGDIDKGESFYEAASKFTPPPLAFALTSS